MLASIGPPRLETASAKPRGVSVLGFDTGGDGDLVD